MGTYTSPPRLQGCGKISDKKICKICLKRMAYRSKDRKQHRGLGRGQETRQRTGNMTEDRAEYKAEDREEDRKREEDGGKGREQRTVQMIRDRTEDGERKWDR